ncbi:uncharacterized protein C11orf91-like [Morone saxatilis]|uniref:uncharacterized protein C11orf91-like n=1 Tax=Morone saxatilis TaxID=34816 RepID=UPI0015E218D4|nr:uncharacterized protein C11orf91-like [Morone saxatilis]
MAAVRYFPSIHDKTTANKKIWAPFIPKPKQQIVLPISSTTGSSKNWNAGVDNNSSTTQWVNAKTPWMTLGCLAVPDYQPLGVFTGTAEYPGPASSGEAEEICELCIRMKEIELCNMIGETSGIPEYTFLRNIKYCEAKPRRKLK